MKDHYDNNIWTVDWDRHKWSWQLYTHASWVAVKKFRPEWALNPWPLQYWCSPLPTELSQHLSCVHTVMILEAFISFSGHSALHAQSFIYMYSLVFFTISGNIYKLLMSSVGLNSVQHRKACANKHLVLLMPDWMKKKEA